MNHAFLKLLLRWAVLAVGVTIAAKLLPGIHCDDAGALIVVVLLLSFFNAILKPLLVLFTLPFIILTMGVGIVVINAFLFYVVGRIVDGFYVESFWWALGGSLIVSLVNVILSLLLRDDPPKSRGTRSRSRKQDAIDI